MSDKIRKGSFLFWVIALTLVFANSSFAIDTQAFAQEVIKEKEQQLTASSQFAKEYAQENLPAQTQAQTQPETPTQAKIKTPFLSDIFVVGMGEGIVGKYDVKSQGNLPTTDHRFKEKVYTEGRLAFYLRATLWNKYKITSSLDTDRKETKLFQNLEDEKYYPTYGDDSVLVEDTPTQGYFYAKAEWDKSYVMYGDYTTGLTGTELSSYNRTLYGGKIDYESVSQTKFNTPKTKLMGYVARAKQLGAHDEMESTGGSLYYLRHKRVIEGSEKIYVQVRDKDTFLPKALVALMPRQDYDIDYGDGRIILNDPLFMTLGVSDDKLIQNGMLNGDPIYLLADYEYESEGYLDNPNYGARVIKEFGNYVKVGGTYAKEVQSATNYELIGTDALIRLNDKNTSNIGLEFATSKSSSTVDSITYNGGLTFSEVATPATENNYLSQAWKVKINYDLKDALKLDALNSLDVNGYYQDIEPGFSSAYTASQEGAKKYGWKLSSKLSDKAEARINYDNQKTIYDSARYDTSSQANNPIVENSMLSTESGIFTAALDYQLTAKAKITQEIRNQDLTNATVTKMEGAENLGATRLAYKFNDTFDAYAQQQYSFSGKKNDTTTLGFSKSFKFKSERVKPKETENNETAKEEDSTVTLNAEASQGNYGDAMRFGISRKEGDGSTSYMNYTIGNDINGNRSALSTFGYRLKFSSEAEIYKEDQFTNNYPIQQHTNILGIDYAPANLPHLTMGASYEKSYLNDNSGASYKDATALKLTYFDTDTIKFSTKFEIRNIKSDITPTRQYATFNQLEYRINPDLRFMGKFNWATNQEPSINTTDGHLKELSAGFGYRPVKNDKLNMLAKYSYIVDDMTSGQVDPQSIAESINHIYSTEGIYQICPRLSLTGKYALKYQKEMGTSETEYIKSVTDLWLARVSFRFFKDFTLHVEDRLLSQYLSETKKNGWLVELTKPIGNLFEVGLGYNFADFNDKDMAYMDGYTARGVYFRFVTKFFESRL